MAVFDVVIIAAGLFAVCGAGFNWDWFMNHRKARALSNLLGRTGARIFYGVFGVGLTVIGALSALGVISLSRK